MLIENGGFYFNPSLNIILKLCVGKVFTVNNPSPSNYLQYLLSFDKFFIACFMF